MIKEEYIKPIPKYIVKLIKMKDDHSYNKYSGLRFFSYFTKYNKELVKVTVAVKSRGKKWACKQVAVHGIHSDICLVKDMEFCFMGGYQVGFYFEGLTKLKWYEDGKWYEAKDSVYDPYSVCVNEEYLLKFPEYKYSKVNYIPTEYAFKYLRLYEQYPEMELMIKAGLHNYVFSKQILRKLKSDNNFKKWILANLKELTKNYFYVSTVLKAYKNNKPLQETQVYEANKKIFMRSENYKNLKAEIGANEYDKFLKYLANQNTNCSSYIDYMNACKELGLDFKDTKNKYPKDFKRWHDIRIDEYKTKTALEDEKKRKKLYEDFKNVANKYGFLERNLKDNFIVIIAKSPYDLTIEGKELHHCVGIMNYDQKFIQEKSLIFFIRNKEDPNTPFVTMEYSLKEKKILQCYGDKDSKPADEVLNFANKIWLPYANRKLKRMVA